MQLNGLSPSTCALHCDANPISMFRVVRAACLQTAASDAAHQAQALNPENSTGNMSPLPAPIPGQDGMPTYGLMAQGTQLCGSLAFVACASEVIASLRRPFKLGNCVLVGPPGCGGPEAGELAALYLGGFSIRAHHEADHLVDLPPWVSLLDALLRVRCCRLNV